MEKDRSRDTKQEEGGGLICPHGAQVYAEDEIDLYELFSVLWRRKSFVLGVIFGGTLLAVVYVLVVPKVYRAKAVLMPIEKTGTPRLPASLAFLGAELGLGGGTGASASQILALLESDRLRRILIERYDLIQVLFPETDNHSPDINDALESLRGIYSVSQDRKLGTITITADFRDPEKAAWLLEILISTLREILVDEQIELAEKTIALLERELEGTEDPLLKKKLYELMAQNIESMVNAKVSRNFIFKVIDPPQIPDKHYKPKRRLIVAVAGISSLFLGIFLAFFAEYVHNVRQRSSKA